MKLLFCIYHINKWLLGYICHQVEVVKSGLQSSLLVRHPETKDLYVNFDPQILTLIREAECMARLQLEVPAAAIDLRAKQNTLKQNYNAVLVRDQGLPTRTPSFYHLLRRLNGFLPKISAKLYYFLVAAQ